MSKFEQNHRVTVESRGNGSMTARTIVENRVDDKMNASDLKIEVSKQLSSQEWSAWDAFMPSEQLMLTSGYLKAIQSTLQDDRGIRFVRLFSNEALVGAFPVQLIWAESNNLEGNTEKKNTILQKLLIRYLVKGDRFRFLILSIGNSFASGENGYHFEAGISIEDQCECMHKALIEIKDQLKLEGHPVSAYLVKDFKRDCNELAELNKKGFAEFKVDPLMVMPILPHWRNYDDYLSNLKSKFRTKAKSAFKKSANLEWRPMEVDEILQNTERIKVLYHAVVDKADFNLGHMKPETFADVKAELGDRFDFYGYFNEGELVGFQSGFRHGKLYDAHMIGVQYEHNQEWSLYSRILYQYVELAIQAGAERISYGRTAGEIKSTIGAFPVELSCCVRHVKNTPNLFLRTFFKFVKPKTYDIRYPYKADIEVPVPA